MLYKQLLTGSIELKANKAQRTVEGYASAFNVLDHDHDVITPGAFAGTLARRGSKVKVLWQHDAHQPIGKPTSMKEDDIGLAVSAKISDTELGNEALTLAADGVVDSFSIGYNVLRREFLSRDAGADSIIAALGGDASSLVSDLSKLSELVAKVATSPRPVRIIKEIELFEFSLVTFPSNEEAVVTGVKDIRSTLRAIEDKVGPSASAALKQFLTIVGTPAFLLDADEDELRPGEERKSFDGAPEEEKAGRVLSKSNFDKLKAAYESIGTVLEAASKKEPEGEGGEPEPPKSDENELDVKAVLGMIQEKFTPRNFSGVAGE